MKYLLRQNNGMVIHGVCRASQSNKTDLQLKEMKYIENTSKLQSAKLKSGNNI